LLRSGTGQAPRHLGGKLTIVPTTRDPSRDLLFGLLALQTGLINQAQLVAAFHAWTQSRDRPMAEILAEQGALQSPCLTLVEGLVIEHLRRHGSDPERSLAAIGIGRSTRECLAQICNGELDASLAQIGSGPSQHEGDPDRTTTYSFGTATSEGQRFRVLRLHARGGLGAVFVALDTELHREVALKQILDSHATDETTRGRFLVEAEITGGLEHPGIVPVYGLGTDGDGRPYYAMRFIRGESLKEAIARFHDIDPVIDHLNWSRELNRLLGRFLDVCHAVGYAHDRGILHRDLKPSNIMLGRYGETLVVDWGLAKVIGRRGELSSAGEATLRPISAADSTPTLVGLAVGTPAYMSPEQTYGYIDTLSPASDIYSLGAILFQILTGQPPFDGGGNHGEVLDKIRRGDFPPPRSLSPQVPPVLETICLRAMALAPADRFAAAAGLIDEIENWMADEPIQSYRSAVASYMTLVHDHPEEPKYREGLARSRIDLGNVLHVLGRHSDAEAAFRDAIEDYRALEDQITPGEPHRSSLYLEGIAATFSKLGRMLTAMGRADDAREAFRAAYARYRELSRSVPGALDHRVEVDRLLPQLGTLEETERELLPATYSADEATQNILHALINSPEGMLTVSALRYTRTRLQAAGGLANVYVARDEFDREVALKEIRDEHADSPQRMARLRMEAEVTAALEHPGIVPVYGMGLHPDGRPFYAMRLIKGESLKDAIARFHADKGLLKDPGRGSLELRSLLGRFRDACNAIEYAHSRGVLHRDIKPVHILIGIHAETVVIGWSLAKLLNQPDGLAGSISTSVEESPGLICGTPSYMSPEQVAGDVEHLGAQSDVYGLGATLYCLLTGKLPYEGRDVVEVLRQAQTGDFPGPRRINPSVPPALEAVCLKAMALRPGDRYPSALALAEEIAHWLADEPVDAYQEGILSRIRRSVRHHRAGVWAVLGFISGMALVCGVLLLRRTF
jgi:serine/threonine protein kinase